MVTKKNWPIHTGIWLFIGVLFVLTIAPLISLEQAIRKVLIGGVSFVPWFYLNMSVVFPRFFKRGQYLKWIAISCGLLLFFIAVRWIMETRLLEEPHLLPNNQQMGTETYRRSHLLFLLLSSSSFLVLNITYWFGHEFQRSKRLSIELAKLHAEAELKYLKLQISPHFLFNVLNNIYSLSVRGDQRAPDMIMKLADSMRYMIYEGGNELVPLQAELSFLENYISLYQLQSAKLKRFVWKVEGNEKNQWVAPLLLLAFIENIFKHGDLTKNPNAHATAMVHIKKGGLGFEAENTFSLRQATKGGIGLENVKNRLEKIYGTGNYHLETEQSQAIYRVKLQIPLKPL